MTRPPTPVEWSGMFVLGMAVAHALVQVGRRIDRATELPGR